ncbi:MAG TPA: Xaa-Pro peptidase family protein [Candidatus Angelobacter sp.]|nr:Xaa-Pro peptidase family protein [Candidatus Angelobacter sp.]
MKTKLIWSSFLSASFMISIITFVSAAAVPAAAQYTDAQALADLGGPKEFERRRQALAQQLLAQEKNGGWLLLFARQVEPEADHYREDNDFYYLTGIADPGAVLLMNIKSGRSVLLEPAQAPRKKQVYGPNVLALPAEEQAKLGFARILPLAELDSLLIVAATEGGPLWLRLGFPDKADGARGEVGRDYADEYAAPYHPGLPLERNAADQIRSRYPQVALRDVTPLLDAMRNIKTPQEIEILRRNGKLSAEAMRDAIAHAHPGIFEYQIEARARFGYANAGAQGVAYPAIVSSGSSLNTWHYFNNRKQIPAGGLVVFDYGADLDHLTMDITRTFNISGKFPPEQAKWYAVDLEAQKAVIDFLRPGHTYEEASEAGLKIYKREGIENQWRGFPGHFVGMATHDVLSTRGPIKPGQIVTVEPIIEFLDKQWHFRVEDTILITDGAPENLSSAVPKEMKEVEALVGSAK